MFPLPNVVLFPRAILPLHIFEQRYKAMTADALESDKLIAMALLKPGWEKEYHGRPEIEPIVCVGQILSWEQLPDGKYNFLLQGRLRARVVHEHFHQPYRIAELEPLAETQVLEIDLERERQRLLGLFENSRLCALPLTQQFRELAVGPIPTADLADLAVFNLLEDVQLKQTLLGESDVRHRIGRAISALEAWASHLNPGLHGLPDDPSNN